MRGATAVLAPKGHVGVGRRRHLARVALDYAGAGWTAERRSAAVVTDKEQCLSGIVRVRTWLAHELSSCNNAALLGWRRIWFFDGYPFEEEEPSRFMSGSAQG